MLHGVALGQALRLGESRVDDPRLKQIAVVFNERDRESVELARYYAAKRGIDPDRLVGIDCSQAEEITREEFDQTIAGPLAREFETRGWWTVKRDGAGGKAMEKSSLHYVVLMRGVPLKVSATTAYVGDISSGPEPVAHRNDASVDSELSVLGRFSRTISGAIINPVYRGFAWAEDSNVPWMLWVCRLDGSSGETVRTMIDRSLEVEKNGLWGFCYVDIRGLKDGGLEEGDKWILGAAKEARKLGYPVILDGGEAMFPQAYPMGHAALYFGWYGEHAVPPVGDPRFQFVPGAIAVHLHSFSGWTVRDPQRNWVGPMVARGAAATMGNVYEPYLGFTPGFDIFLERLAKGMGFAEAAYASQRALSWMTTFVGDPLYKPFALWNEFYTDLPVNEWTAYRAGSLEWFAKGRGPGGKMLRESGMKMKSGVVFEGLGLLQASVNDLDGAWASWRKAREFYKDPEDAVRCAIHEVNTQRIAGKKEDVLRSARRLAEEHAATRGAGVLRGIVEELTPKPSPTASPVPTGR